MVVTSVSVVCALSRTMLAAMIAAIMMARKNNAHFRRARACRSASCMMFPRKMVVWPWLEYHQPPQSIQTVTPSERLVDALVAVDPEDAHDGALGLLTKYA